MTTTVIQPPAGLGFSESTDWLINQYYSWFAIFGAAALVFLFGLLTPSPGRSKREGYYLAFAINWIAAMAYFAMARRQARVFVIENDHAYEVYYARYIDWTFTTPLLLTHLIIFAGLAWQQWIFILLCDIGMVVTGLIGNLVSDKSRWAWFAFGCFFQIIVSLALFGPVRKHAFSRIKRQGTVFMIAASYLTLVWLGYPIVWILEAGSRTISPTAGGCAYAILDFFAKPVFTFMLFGLHKHLDSHHASLDGPNGDEETGGEGRRATDDKLRANVAPGQPGVGARTDV